MNPDEYLTVAFRAWTGKRGTVPHPSAPVDPPRRILVIDTETTIDTAQSLTFGFARLARLRWRKNANGRAEYFSHHVETEVAFHADDLPETDPVGYGILEQYTAARGIDLVTRTEFMEQYVWRYCVARKNRKGNILGDATLVGFNLPFDLSRLAYGFGDARNTRAADGAVKVARKGSFSLRMFPDVAPCLVECSRRHRHITEREQNRYRPRLTIRHMDSKKAAISWTFSADSKADRELSAKRRQFLDLRQLIWGMTNRATSLAAACEMFALPKELHKARVEEHGTITKQYVAYARQDVRATTELCVRALSEYVHHPINLPPSKVFSPASIAKAYLREMGITPMLERPGIPADPLLMGNCVATFYGGRAEAHIRNTVVPVTVCDFTSMYPTVNTLMHLWDHVTAKTLTVLDGKEETEQFIRLAETVAHNGAPAVLDPNIWPKLTGFVQIIPDSDVLPVRAHYGTEAYNVGINRFTCRIPVWYTMSDVLASCLLAGKAPKILAVVRFVPGAEKLDTLASVALGGTERIDPARDDFFKMVVERRAAIKAKISSEASGQEVKRNAEALKVLANSGSYGIYVEMLRNDSAPPRGTPAYGIYDQPWESTPNAVEQAQEFCYPPIGAVITGAARLMLAIVEKLVTDAGGTWLFCDTDSMAIVTNRNGGRIPCDGGPKRMPDGRAAITALSHAQVQRIRDTINRLNPYDRRNIPELLKDETGSTNKANQVYGYAISAKRYCLFTYENGAPVVPGAIDGKDAFMQHGLGLYLNPADPDDPAGRDWIRQTWQWIVDRAHGQQAPDPEWARNPALSQITISSPFVMRAFHRWNQDKEYRDMVKPFNFVLLVSEDRTKINPGETFPRRFLAPYSADPAAWLTQEWQTLTDPAAPPIRVTTGPANSACIPVRAHRIVLLQYLHHREWKSAMSDGKPCAHSYNGLLFRRTVRAKEIVHIGKESNRIDDVQHQMIDNFGQVFTQYPHEDRSIIRHAFANLTTREIARIVNDESEEIRNRVESFQIPERNGAIPNHLDPYRALGFPVTVNHATMVRFFNGAHIKNALQAHAITRTAAKRVAADVGVNTVRIGYHSQLIAPDVVLAMWVDSKALSPKPHALTEDP
ncbi:hypothetical protein [Streptomyces sp. YGL11-2]|uniref:hypothetical protein n=1 Tax=Streptomyces sp. YGL11-2 TaxID=3414028 RepID=UPI003CFBAEA8